MSETISTTASKGPNSNPNIGRPSRRVAQAQLLNRAVGKCAGALLRAELLDLFLRQPVKDFPALVPKAAGKVALLRAAIT